MAKISIEISTTTSTGKKDTINVSYINPEATNEQLIEFSRKLVAFTTETYHGTTKITKESVV